MRSILLAVFFLTITSQLIGQKYFSGELVYETVSNYETNGKLTRIYVDSLVIIETVTFYNQRFGNNSNMTIFDRSTSQIFVCDSVYNCALIDKERTDTFVSFEPELTTKIVGDQECMPATVVYSEEQTISFSDMERGLENLPDSLESDLEFIKDMLEEGKALMGNSYSDIYYRTYEVCIQDGLQIESHRPYLMIPFIFAHGKVYIPLEYELKKFQSNEMMMMGVDLDDMKFSPTAGHKSKEVLISINSDKVMDYPTIKSSMNMVDIEYFFNPGKK